MSAKKVSHTSPKANPEEPEEAVKFLVVHETDIGKSPSKSKSTENLPTSGSALLPTSYNKYDPVGRKLLKAKYSLSKSTESLKWNKSPAYHSNFNNNATNPSCENACPKDLLSSSEKQQVGIKRFLGIFLALVAALQFSLSALIIKVLKYHPFNLGVWRFGFMMFVPIPFLIHAAGFKKENILKDIWPATSTTVFLMLQAVLGANSIIFVFYGLKYLNIADSIVIGTSAPVFVTLFAFIFLGERCGVFPVLTAILALIGVGIISKPPMLTGAEKMTEDSFFGVASSFSSMILLTICYVVVRYLRNVHHAVVNLFFAMWGFIQSLILANVMGVLETPKNYQEIILIVITAFLAFFAQTCITVALKYEQAGPVALVRTMEVVFAFLWQALFLGVQPDLWSVLGAAVTLTGVVLTALRKMVMSLPDDNIQKKRLWFLLV